MKRKKNGAGKGTAQARLHQHEIYGFFCGGDPRDFTPDVECCTVLEIAAHKAAVDAWNVGNKVNYPGSHIPLHAPSHGHLLLPVFGIGTTSFDCVDHRCKK